MKANLVAGGSAPGGHGPWKTAVLSAATLAAVLVPAASLGVNLAAPPSLKTISVPTPGNLDLFVKSRIEAIALGKALFWDMQVGSDGVQACASCHFHAGSDSRSVNVMSPGLLRVDPVTLAPSPDGTFQAMVPNGTVSQDKFPFTQFLDPGDRTSPMIRAWNDIVSSPGVFHTTYVGQPKTGAVEQGTPVPDPVFNVSGLNTRRVEPRNAPTVVNAVFNFANFWDGRANSFFNGSSPFGDADPDAGVWIVSGGVPQKIRVRIPFGSLASQAVGPPGSDFEMSFAGRTFPDIGKKLLPLVPLAKQDVHPLDSVLGRFSNSTIGSGGRMRLVAGLKTTYLAMVKAAFHDQYWNSGVAIFLPQGIYSQMEANFALFFGLAIQLYESTLVSDDSPFDRFQAGDSTAMSPSAQEGLNLFLTTNEQGGTGGSCINCHGTSTFTNASVMHIGTTNFGASLPEGLVERMIVGDLGGAWYDAGFYNIGVTPWQEDPGRGGRDPFGNPLSFIERSLLVFNGQTDQLSYDPFATDPPGVMLLPCGPNDPFGRVCPADQRVTTLGAFKVPTLRNVELTGPYMHNGGHSTLMQVVDFYARGGNFFENNLAFVDIDIQPLFGINPNPILNPGGFTNPGGPVVGDANQRKLIDFMLALTDDRVRWEKAPFDHPALLIPNGGKTQTCGTAGQTCDTFVSIPAVGASGLGAEKLSPLGTFLNLSPYQP